MTEIWPQIAQLRTHIAWLGETGRFGFWQSDALSAEGGGAMLAHILPRTGAWAALQVAWSCAALVEARRVSVRDALTLFRLGPAIDFKLTGWLRRQKRQAAPVSGLVPAEAPFSSAADALSAWQLVPPATVSAAKRLQPLAGAESIAIGVVNAPSMETPEGILHAAERLAAAYVHSSMGSPVVPFLEVR